MPKPFKDLPYNKTHDLRVDGKLVKKNTKRKPTISDVLNAVQTMETKQEKFNEKQEKFNEKQNNFNNKIIKRLDNLVVKNNLKE